MLTFCAADKPNEDPNVRGDAFKTLIVARLSYEADERDLEKEFGRFGPIERVCFSSNSPRLPRLVTNELQIRIIKDTHADEKPGKKKKPHRGYAFVVFEREKDMRGNYLTLLSPFDDLIGLSPLPFLGSCPRRHMALKLASLGG